MAKDHVLSFIIAQIYSYTPISVASVSLASPACASPLSFPCFEIAVNNYLKSEKNPDLQYDSQTA